MVRTGEAATSPGLPRDGGGSVAELGYDLVTANSSGTISAALAGTEAAAVSPARSGR